jgi:hypothetical protein
VSAIGEAESLHGWDAPMTTTSEREGAIDAAFDYRGDVTVTLNDGRSLLGFVSNRDFNAAEPYLEIITPDWASPQRIPLDRVTGVHFTGVDAAAGKSWDLWLKKVAQAEAEGKIAELYPEEH